MHMHLHHHNHSQNQREGNKSGLWIAIFITAGIMVLEFIGGFLTNSLALLSDSGHMLSDTLSLFLSLLAMILATKKPSEYKTYGFYRFEILAAFINSISLFIVAGFIIWEAYERFLEPPVVKSNLMLIIASIGLLANLISVWVLAKKGDIKENLNIRSAYLHILGDALGSIGVIIAGLLMLFSSWYLADPIISVLVSLLILKSAWKVLKQSNHILMQGTPMRINKTEITETLESIPGVINVHNLHIWTLTSGLDLLTCHLLIEDNQESQKIFQQAIDRLEPFHIQYPTVQIETLTFKHAYCRTEK